MPLRRWSSRCQRRPGRCRQASGTMSARVVPSGRADPPYTLRPRPSEGKRKPRAMITFSCCDAPKKQPSDVAIRRATPPGGRGAEALPAGPRPRQPGDRDRERSGAGGTKHIRRFMVDHAPALFLVACGDPRCTEGEHDLTHEIMRALRARQTSFRGSDDCAGSIGSSSCLRVIHFEGTARYRPAPNRTAVPVGVESKPGHGP